MALLVGLQVLRELGFMGVIMVGNSASAISWGKGDCMGPWRLASLIHEIQDLVHLLNPSFALVLGFQNDTVDSLAKSGVS